jgi:iron complex outermembrane receptor protein
MKVYANKQSKGFARVRLAFQLSPVAAGCAVFVSAFAGHAYAQTEPAAQAGAAPITSVTVTGIRRGIEAAISVKKNSDSIVEAISAEDIGKLPDSSIAESIARLPGVTAQRTAGRASAVSIRGMSPDFSTALLNGREQVSTGDSRGVEFDQYPSELLSGVVIYKTPDGALVGQGLSGTVDLQTVRPLDFGKRTVAVNYRKERAALGTESRGKGNRFSLSYIDQFADRTVGLALGFARLDGTSGATTRFESWGNGEVKEVNGQSLGQDASGKDITVKVPYNGFNAWTDESTQSRDGAMAALQFRPSRDFSSTLDMFYSKFDRAKITRGFQAPLNDGTSNAYDQPGHLINAVISNGSAVSGTFNNVRAVVRNDAEKTSDESYSYGWNNKLKLNADWTASLDLSYNSASREGSNAEAYAGTTGALDKVSFTAGSHAFTTGFNYADPAVTRLTDVQGWGGADIQAGYTKLPNVFDKIKAIRFDVSRELPEGLFFSKITTGVNFSDRSKRREFTEALLAIKGGGQFASAAMPGGVPGTAGDTGIPILTFDPVANAAAVYDFRRKDHPDIWNKDWVVNEKVTTAFAKLGIDSSIASMPLRGAFGLQMIRTKQDSTAYSVDKNGGTNDTNRPVATVSAGTSYTDVLPSLNLIGDLGNEQSIRLSLAKIMARPTMNDMRASNGFSYDATKAIYTGSGGNPKLDPFRAKGIDISYEKYWDNKAYVSLAGFYKKLDTYIITTGQTYDFTPVLLPTTVKAPSNIGTFTAPINGSGGNIKGVEFAVSVPLNLAHRWLDGFGVVLNGSQTSSEVNVPDTSDGGSGTMGLPGLSKRVAALTLYYEKAGYSARIAERYRSDFIGEVTSFAGDRQATYIKAEKIVDLQLGYEFQGGPLKGASLLVQMNNLTNAKFVRYRKTQDNIIEETQYGRTVLFGVNYKM